MESARVQIISHRWTLSLQVSIGQCIMFPNNCHVWPQYLNVPNNCPLDSYFWDHFRYGGGRQDNSWSHQIFWIWRGGDFWFRKWKQGSWIKSWMKVIWLFWNKHICRSYVSMQGLQKGKWRLENNGHSSEVELLDREVAKVRLPYSVKMCWNLCRVCIWLEGHWRNQVTASTSLHFYLCFGRWILAVTLSFACFGIRSSFHQQWSKIL